MNGRAWREHVYLSNRQHAALLDSYTQVVYILLPTLAGEDFCVVSAIEDQYFDFMQSK